LTVLKEQAIDLIDNLMQDMNTKMSTVKIPDSDTSDMEKNNIKIFHMFFKIFLTASEIHPVFLVSVKNQP